MTGCPPRARVRVPRYRPSPDKASAAEQPPTALAPPSRQPGLVPALNKRAALPNLGRGGDGRQSPQPPAEAPRGSGGRQSPQPPPEDL